MTSGGPAGAAPVVLFSLTTFLGSALLFLVQPMLGKMLLPGLGGTPAVWNTCLLFFQALLLLGYLYAHGSARVLGLRRQPAVHLAALLAGFLVLPIRLPAGWEPPTTGSPVAWLLGVLTVSAGLPFLLVSSGAPLLQHWFAATGHPRAGDPYFLYATSNLGSLVALLAYPALVETSWGLAAQSRIWMVGYGGLVGLFAACAVVRWRSRSDGGASAAATAGGTRPSMAERLRWAFLALVPSSLLLSVTTYLTTDIAAAPFLWVAPLALYLLTYVLAFARRPWVPGRALALGLPVAVMVPILAYLVRVPVPARLFVPVHLAVFFLAAASCHRELAARRPAPDRLTEYYVWVSVGGVLGGAFNTLVAPLVFALPAEYPLGLVLACLARPVATGARQPLRVTWLWALPPGVAGLVLVLPIVERAVGVEPRSIEGLALTFGLPLLVCGAAWPRPAVFALGLTAVLVAGSLRGDLDLLVLSRVRTFFGVHQVMRDPAASLHLYLHGTTLHGAQATQPDDRREPLSYFRRDGPIGELLRGVGEARPDARVAVIGLGIGTLAAYATPGQRWTFFEIDPSVERIARDPRFFTYLADAPTQVEVVLGDARLSLARVQREAYDVIVLDAFSSDAVPVHLLTREAIELYLTRLGPGGTLAFNITNRHVRLEGVLGALARTLGLTSAVRYDQLEDAPRRPGLFPARWLLMARHPEDLGPHVRPPRWRPPAVPVGQAVWTDDHSSLVPVLRWGAAS